MGQLLSSFVVLTESWARNSLDTTPTKKWLGMLWIRRWCFATHAGKDDQAHEQCCQKSRIPHVTTPFFRATHKRLAAVQARTWATRTPSFVVKSLDDRSTKNCQFQKFGELLNLPRGRLPEVKNRFSAKLTGLFAVAASASNFRNL